VNDGSIIIIGAGMGGLSAGIFGRVNGYRTTIFEQQHLPGGQCTAWKRRGYTFDACIHHLFGCSEAALLYGLWREVGAMPRRLVPLQECVSVLSPEGTLFRDYYDLELLESHMNELAPGDGRVIGDYIRGIRTTAQSDVMGRMMLGTKLDLVFTLPTFLRSVRWLRPTMARYGARFTDPFLRRAVPLLVYSNPDIPLIVHLSRHAYGLTGALQWPVGGSLPFAESMARRYVDLGGELRYRSKVVEVLTEGSRATGVRLGDGTAHAADIVISNVDGRRTILELLGGRFMDERIRRLTSPPPDEMPFAVQVFLGVNRDLSAEPSSMIILLDRPAELAGRTCGELELQTYGFDPTMAPPGKGVIKVELTSRYSYWKGLAQGGTSRYAEAKQELAERVIDLLDQHRFSGLRGQVEVVDVSTLLTWERFLGSTMGLGMYLNKKTGVLGSVFGKSQESTLPGLESFHLAGTWATSAGALFMNALSGKRVIQDICGKHRRRFVTAS
jgi:phytoene dehydrogenase-like protein